MTRDHKPAQHKKLDRIRVPKGATPQERAAYFRRELKVFLLQQQAEEAAARGRLEDGA